jgi:hypothetical protein
VQIFVGAPVGVLRDYLGADSLMPIAPKGAPTTSDYDMKSIEVIAFPQ